MTQTTRPQARKKTTTPSERLNRTIGVHWRREADAIHAVAESINRLSDALLEIAETILGPITVEQQAANQTESPAQEIA